MYIKNRSKQEINYGKQNSFEILHLLTWQGTLLYPQERGVSSFLLNKRCANDQGFPWVTSPPPPPLDQDNC